MSAPSTRELSREEKQELLRRVLVERVSRSRTAPASFAQERLWFLDRVQGAPGVYNIPAALRLSGALNVPALERALGEIVRRHEPLRTVFREVDGRPLQVIAPFTAFSLPMDDLAALADDAREDEVRRRAAGDAARAFDLAAGPVFRASLLRLGDDEHVLLICVHHAVSDGWSMGVLFRELSALYKAYKNGVEAQLPPCAVRYADIAERQRAEVDGQRLNAQLAYWVERLAGAPALLELPTDHPRPAAQSHRGAREVLDLSARLADGLEALGRGERATPYMVLLAGFAVLLARYAGTDDVVVGTAVSGRADPGVEALIGFFANTLALRTDLSGDPSFRQALRRVRAVTLDAQRNAEVPFERVVEAVQPERSTSHAPLFQVMFTLNEAHGAPVDLPGVTAAEVDAELATAKFDLALAFAPHARGLRGVLAYDTDLFDRATIRRMLRHLARVLEQAADDADLPLSRLDLLDEAERAQVLDACNRTDAAYPAAAIHRLFEEQARATPDAVALVLGDQALTYAKLNARANRLAHHLRALGVGAETRVGLCLERGVEMIVSILAVLKAGGAYVPLDLSYPAERLAWMLADAGAAVLVTEDAPRDAVPAAAVRVVSLDADRAAIDACSADDLRDAAGGGGMAYVMYTSGSTGTPKGVAVEHRNVVRLVRGANYAAFGADQVILQAAPVSFDASTLEIWGALLNGGRLVLTPGRAPSAEALGRAIVRHGVTTVWLTAGLFAVMVEERLDDLRGVRQLLAGGDVLPAGAVRRVRERFPDLRLINGYGPTENTTFTCCHTVDDAWRGGPVPIGTPVSNTRVYVLDAAGRPLPIGVPGELYAAGDGVARGYLGRPGATAERFVPDPFSATPGARMYRTGDRARWKESAGVRECVSAEVTDKTTTALTHSRTHALEFLGRLDTQVKIRGFRIEPGEIAAVLRRHPAVTGCAVIVRQDAPGEKRLVAYVVGDADADVLREHLRRTLPDYMVPGAFVALAALPLTPNGKTDTRALPAPELAADAYAAPRTPVEATLAAIWAEVLRAERVGRTDEFFRLGGHSLLAMRIVSRVREAFGVELPVRELFEGPTVARLAERVEALRRAGVQPLPPVVPMARDVAPPLSFAQERLWFLDRMQGPSGVYNVPAALRLSGALDVPALERALGEIVRRHEALRTVFRGVDGVPVQVIAPFAGFALPIAGLSALPAGAREAEVRRRAADDGGRPFDLAAGPLVRASLLRLADDEHVLLICIHHAVSDGWSMGVLFRELSALYETFQSGAESPLPPLPVQYADFAVWQRSRLAGEALDRQLAYWKAQLADAPALLELPADHPRPALQSNRGARQPVAFPADLLHRLEALARREGATLYMVLLGAFQVLLGRYAGTDDVVVGSPVAGRTRREVEDLIGFFVNTLALRTDLSGDPSFREVVRRVRAATLGAHENQDLPFERLVAELQPERSLSHSPLFQVVFTLEDAQTGRATLPGLRTERVEADLATTKFDLTLALSAEPDGLRGILAYCTDLFERATIQRMLRHLERVLDQVADDAGLPVSRLDLMDDADRAQVLDAWNRTDVAYPATSIHRLFEAQARATPHALAVVFDEATLTYGELNARANRLAHHLRARGVGPETHVGLCLERGMEMVIATLAILKAGGAYVPLDLSYPAERVEWMLADARLAILVTEDAHRATIPAAVPVVSLDADRAAIGASPADDLRDTVGGDGLAHVMYTSGSTGTPKGVAVEHRNVVRLVYRASYAGFGQDVVVLQASPVSFDGSTLEIWTALLNGGRLVLMPGRTPSVRELGRAIVRHGVTTVWLTAGLFQVMVEERIDDLRGIRHLLTGGDVVPVEAVRRVRERFPELRLINGYGPTENTIFTTLQPIDHTWRGGPVPIGSPVRNTRVYVMDTAGRPLPVGVPGELYAAGAGVVRGYLGRPAATAARFVPDPFSPTPGARMYRTGDRARWTESAGVRECVSAEVTDKTTPALTHSRTHALEFLGRMDKQVKIRGFRIEPGEIAAVLRRHPAVTDCTVIVRADAPGEKRLVAYFVGDADADVLREHLRRTLPDYMIPAAFVALAALPLTPNGKVDTRALPAPELAANDAAYVAPRTPTEATLAAIWAEVLRVERVGMQDDFFRLGGHSLMAMRIVSRIRDALGVELPVRELFEGPTVARLAERVEAMRGAAAAPAPPALTRAARTVRRPVAAN